MPSRQNDHRELAAILSSAHLRARDCGECLIDLPRVCRHIDELRDGEADRRADDGDCEKAGTLGGRLVRRLPTKNKMRYCPLS